ncbi:LysR family transcriptional regulator [Ramlibacter sp. H39-3-26]|uniref:LysR family transcriptional regulator n=1 Tax=Curvibacter soli TaxID=3031331 RepID=UPI0023DAF411|nr:LysR substrate-binding domain-containing protein [Ramlibacter sp. H39-3-26]
MKLHQLQYFVATAEHGSVRAAAHHLGISATAVSRALTELEEGLKTLLIERQAQGIVLTCAGRSLLTHARLVLNQLKQASREMEDLRAQAPVRLSIGVTPWFAQSILPLLITRFLQRRPDVELHIVEFLGMHYAPLRDGSIDLAIGLWAPDAGPAELQAQPLFSYTSAVVCRMGHARAHARSIYELRGEEWMLSRDWREFGPPFSDIFEPAAERPPRIHIAHSALMTMTQVEMTDILSIAPWPLIESQWLRGRLQAMHLQELFPERLTCLLTRRNHVPTTASRDFIECVYDSIAQAQQSDDPMLRRVLRTIEPQPALQSRAA